MTRVTLYLFLSRTNLKLLNSFVTPKMVKKVIMNLDLPKAYGPDCIVVVALKKCEPELSYMLVELFNKCLNSSISVFFSRLLESLIGGPSI